MNVHSKMFYDNDLKAIISDVDSDDSIVLKKLSPILPNHGNRNVTEGVIFIGVKGKNARSNESPSWFNEEEADAVSIWTNTDHAPTLILVTLIGSPILFKINSKDGT